MPPIFDRDISYLETFKNRRSTYGPTGHRTFKKYQPNLPEIIVGNNQWVSGSDV